MDIDKLRKLSQEGQKNIEKFCNPRQIAQEITSKLEIEATKCAQAGKKNARVSYVIWSRSCSHEQYNKHDIQEGPLVNCANRSDLSRVLFDVVKNYITDNEIQLRLEEFNDKLSPASFWQGAKIIADLSW